jgi:hypothetical protein
MNKVEAWAWISTVVAILAIGLAFVSYDMASTRIRRTEAKVVRYGYATHVINEYGDIELQWHPSGENE